MSASSSNENCDISNHQCESLRVPARKPSAASKSNAPTVDESVCSWRGHDLDALRSRVTCKTWAAAALSQPERLLCTSGESLCLQPASMSKGEPRQHGGEAETPFNRLITRVRSRNRNLHSCNCCCCSGYRTVAPQARLSRRTFRDCHRLCL